MTRRVLFFCLFISHFCFSQTEKYPTFEVCKNEPIENIKDCFYKQVKETFYERFKEPPIINLDLQGNYLLNARNNLSLFAGLQIRNFNPEMPTPTFKKDTNVWFSAGVRVDLFNWYFDF